MKKNYFIILLFLFIFSFSSISISIADDLKNSYSNQLTNSNNFNKGDVLIYLEGGVSWSIFGNLLDKEDSALNPKKTALYNTGESKESEFSYFGVKYGLVVEKMISNQIGLGFGYSLNNTDRELKIGGGNYEEKSFGTDKKYMEYKNPFVSLNWYCYKTDNFNFALITRLGIITDGKYKDKRKITSRIDDGSEYRYIYNPATGKYEYIKIYKYKTVSSIENGDTINFNGYNVAIGGGLNFIFKNNLFFGSNVLLNFNQVKFQDSILSDFSEKTDTASFTSIDWNFYVGVKI